MVIKNFSHILPILILLLSSDMEDQEVTLLQRIEAAKETANTNSNCVDIIPYYWEIGSKDGALVSGSPGDQSIARTTMLPIASATKWMFGAYVVQAKAGSLESDTIEAMTMSSGYTSFGNLSCAPNYVKTVSDCFNVGDNDEYTPGHDHYFYYNGGHFQKLAMDNGLGPLSESELVAEFQDKLGGDYNLIFGSPQLAGGITTNAEQYAIFLQSILDQQLFMYNHLGANAVCTNPDTCSTSIASPYVHQDFHYSYGHWVEDDPVSGDGAFSSAGLFGFYPWINAQKTLYGVISRYEVPGGVNDIGSGAASQACGSLVRRAFETGYPR